MRLLIRRTRALLEVTLLQSAIIIKKKKLESTQIIVEYRNEL